MNLKIGREGASAHLAPPLDQCVTCPIVFAACYPISTIAGDRACCKWMFVCVPTEVQWYPGCCFLAAARRAQYDKFGEEGLKGGVPTKDGGTSHVVCHVAMCRVHLNKPCFQVKSTVCTTGPGDFFRDLRGLSKQASYVVYS